MTAQAKNDVISLIKTIAILVGFWASITSSLATKESVTNMQAQVARIETRVDALYNRKE